MAGTPSLPGRRLARFREEIARLLIQPLELGRLPRLVRADRAQQRHATLPGAQVALLARALLEQRRGVAFGSREPVHVVGQVAGEHVFAQQRMYGESRFGQRWFGGLGREASGEDEHEHAALKSVHDSLRFCS